ncbi:Fcf2-domain-containing protein [Anaeromyces robustus]|uniref:Fcf2-domain-containing protein n=1 Tax=Anaeromyces robustus TaxID=1754192 RepID=A0A1Y1XEJ6_9FUNG|nr:Fcf2-domain-containing protein [Anaeromyces robustus]|eukprot:ORX84188.1 Fcf2-domain-containing protein [Anaeromyces robustus]
MDNDLSLDDLLLKASENLKKKEKEEEVQKKSNSDSKISNIQSSSQLSTGVDNRNFYLKRNKNGVVKLDSAVVDITENNKINNKNKKALEKVKIEGQSFNLPKEEDKKTETAGSKWFDMPAPEITPEIKLDLQLIKMRNVLDRKRHYKKDESKGLPKYFQVGRIIEDKSEYFSSRLTKKERKNTLLDEIMNDVNSRQYFKRKFNEIQKASQSGIKKSYNKGKKGKKRRN